MAKTPAFANIFRKTRTYFRGGTVLYRVGALEGTTFSPNKMYFFDFWQKLAYECKRATLIQKSV